jgi:hypothetical protein
MCAAATEHGAERPRVSATACGSTGTGATKLCNGEKCWQVCWRPLKRRLVTATDKAWGVMLARHLHSLANSAQLTLKHPLDCGLIRFVRAFQARSFGGDHMHGPLIR